MADEQLLKKLDLYIKQHWIPQEKTLPRSSKKRGSVFSRLFPFKNKTEEAELRPEPDLRQGAELRPEPALRQGAELHPEPDVLVSEELLQQPNALRSGFAMPQKSSLDDRLKYLDESFSQMLLRKIDEAGIKDSECYNRAQLNRALFNKIKNDPKYRTSKETAVALGLALRLPKDEFRELVAKAGYSLSNSSKFDIIIEFCIDNSIFSIMEVNELLFAHDQTLLGSK